MGKTGRVSMSHCLHVLKPYIALNSGFVDDFVNVVSRNARLRSSACNVQNLASVPTYFAHRILLLLVQDGDLIPVDKHLF